MHKKSARWMPLYSYLKVILHALNEVGYSCNKVYVIINFLKLNKILSYFLPETLQSIFLFYMFHFQKWLNFSNERGGTGAYVEGRGLVFNGFLVHPHLFLLGTRKAVRENAAQLSGDD